MVPPDNFARIRLLRILLDHPAPRFEQRHRLSQTQQLHRQQNPRSPRAHHAHIRFNILNRIVDQIPNQAVPPSSIPLPFAISPSRSRISASCRSLPYPSLTDLSRPAAAIRLRAASSGRYRRIFSSNSSAPKRTPPPHLQQTSVDAPPIAPPSRIRRTPQSQSSYACTHPDSNASGNLG